MYVGFITVIPGVPMSIVSFVRSTITISIEIVHIIKDLYCGLSYPLVLEGLSGYWISKGLCHTYKDNLKKQYCNIKCTVV